MIILMHVIIALTSIVLSTVSAFTPSRGRIISSYVLIALTLATGTYLVISMHTPMLRACATGLVYLAIALSGVLVGQRRFATERKEIDQ